jgi:hypothetical protein
MAFVQRDQSGSLFRNDKATSDKHPTHKGSALIDGAEFWVSAWVKDGKPGPDGKSTRFFSLAFEPKTRDESAETRAAAVLGRAFGIDPDEVLALLGGGNASQSPPAAPGRAAASPPNWDDDIPF